MSAFHWFVVLASISSLVFAWATYILESFKKRTEKTAIDEEEEKLVELIGKVRIFVDSKLEQLDRKMEEAKALIKDLNEQYVSLAALAVQLQNQLQKTESPSEMEANQKLKNESFKENGKTETIGKFSNIDAELSADEKALIQGYVLKNKPTYSTRVPEKREEIIDEYEKYEKNEYTDDAKNKKEELIFDMYLSGLEPVEIAKKMKMGVGEVQLIIDLMKRQKP
jgi:ribosome-binding ATPase YchF (GTP1/OBG family)